MDGGSGLDEFGGFFGHAFGGGFFFGDGLVLRKGL
jgi:hypothetical protein